MEDKKPIKSILTNEDINRLKMVVRTARDFDNIKSDDLYNKLNEKYKNKGTFSVLSYTLKKYFLEIGEQTKADYWGNKGAELSQIVNTQESKNELTNNEKQNWKDQKQIIDIMNNIDIKTRTDYNRFLILAMTTFQPPLRKAFYCNLKFIFDLKDNNNKDNFLYLQRQPKKSFYIVNDDKVSKYEKFNDKDSMFIEIGNKDLIKLLWDSYKQNKRPYVFESDKGEPYSMNSISKVLLETPFDLNFNILRSSYVTNYYENNNSLFSKNELARRMRHSQNISQQSYFKDV
jgi:hypothetical protein